MYTTSDIKKVKVGDYKYIFFINNRDCFENKRDFVIQLNILIERFSRQLEDQGLVVKTYEPDTEKTRQEILEKPWGKFKLKTIKKTPGILMLDKDFNQFNPNKDNWIYFYFCKDQRYRNNIGNEYTVDEAEELFDKLAEIITKNDCNIFKKVNNFVLMNKSKRIGKAILKEAVNCGIGISADKFFDVISNMDHNEQVN